jgi:hypothetical protein
MRKRLFLVKTLLSPINEDLSGTIIHPPLGIVWTGTLPAGIGSLDQELGNNSIGVSADVGTTVPALPFNWVENGSWSPLTTHLDPFKGKFRCI